MLFGKCALFIKAIYNPFCIVAMKEAVIEAEEKKLQHGNYYRREVVY